MMATIFQGVYLRGSLFFGCMGLFIWLFRGEIVEKSLHYYFLSPFGVKCWSWASFSRAS